MNEARRAVEAERNQRLSRLISLSSKCQSLSPQDRRVTKALLNSHLKKHARLEKVDQLSNAAHVKNSDGLRQASGDAFPLPPKGSIMSDGQSLADSIVEPPANPLEQPQSE